MSKENLPLELYEKHVEALALHEPLFFDSDHDLFRELPSPAKSAVVFLPKSKALINMTLAIVSGMVEEGGTIVLAGENDAGIRSAKELYEKNIGPVEQKIVGNHSALYVGKNKRLGAGKKIEDYLAFSPLEYDGISLEVANLPGVFSAGELDEGTELLLGHIPYDKKKVLDVGCGGGVIGAIYKKKNPEADVTMTDMSALAVKAASKTLEKNGIAATVVLSDVFEGISGKFDMIVSNPPFHTGVATDYSFIERFSCGAKAHLNPGGEVWIVANAFLSYEETLRKNVGPVDLIAENKKFKILRAKA